MSALPETAGMLSDLELPLPIDLFLKIALSLAEMLDQIHMHNITFGALAPNSIWYDGEATQCYILDFCYCRISNNVGFEEEIEWTNVLPSSLLPYIAPEYIKHNRTVYSTVSADLYSLGIVLFELITGQSPFDCEDQNQFLHAHVALKPCRADEYNTKVPGIIALIIDKLLEKDPAKRYSTAIGLYSDLAHCMQYVELSKEWRSAALERSTSSKKVIKSTSQQLAKLFQEEGEVAHSPKIDIPAFPLGLQDISDSFEIPDRLFARDNELATIGECIKSVEQYGGRQIIYVTGPAGSGKSAIISALLRQLNHETWFSLTLGFDNIENNSSIIDNSDYLLSLLSKGLETRTIGNQILSRSKFEVDQWRDRLGTLLSGEGKILLNYVPSLLEVMGPMYHQQNDYTSIKPTPQVLFTFICKLITLLAGPGHPLVLAIDNMQWITRPMLQLFITLTSLPGLSHIIFLLAYREDSIADTTDTEIVNKIENNSSIIIPENNNLKNNSYQLLRAAITHCEQFRLPIAKISLTNFTTPTIQDIIIESIGIARTDKILPLAELVYKKTNGNPLFVIQFLRTIYTDHLLRFDDIQRKWIWDTEKIQKKQFTSNVVDFMISEIGKLSSKQKQILQIASCIGIEFDVPTLFEILLELKPTIGNRPSPPQNYNLTKEKKKRTRSKPVQLASPINSSEEEVKFEEKRKSTRALNNSGGSGYAASDDVTEKYILDRLLLVAEKDMLLVNRNNQTGEIISFTFSHERIHQAAYLSQLVSQRKKIHLLIGKLWLQEYQRNNDYNIMNIMSDDEDFISLSSSDESSAIDKSFPPYFIVRQLNLGSQLINDRSFQLQLALFNLYLVRKASKESSFEQQLELSKVGIELLVQGDEEAAWKNHHEILIEFYISLYKRLPEDDISIYSKLVERAKSNLHKVKIAIARIDHLIRLNNLPLAIEICKACILDVLNIQLSEKPSIKQIYKLHKKLTKILPANFCDLLEKSELNHENRRARKEEPIIMPLKIHPKTGLASKEDLSEFQKIKEKKKLEAQKLVEENELKKECIELINNCIEAHSMNNQHYLSFIELSIISVEWVCKWDINPIHAVNGLIIYSISCIHLFRDVSLAMKILPLFTLLRNKYPNKNSLFIYSYLHWFHYWENNLLTAGIHDVNTKEEELWDCFKDLISQNLSNKATNVIQLIANTFYHSSNISLSFLEQSLLKSVEVSHSQKSTMYLVKNYLYYTQKLMHNNSPNSNQQKQIDQEFIMNENNAPTNNLTIIISCHIAKMQFYYLNKEIQVAQEAMNFVNSNIECLFGRIEKFYFHFWSVLILSTIVDKFKRIYKDKSPSSPSNNPQTTTNKKPILQGPPPLPAAPSPDFLPNKKQSNESPNPSGSYPSSPVADGPVSIIDEIFMKIENHINEMKFWTQYSPVNFEHCLSISQAEYCRLKDDNDQACEFYRKAIIHASSNEFYQFEGLAHEQLSAILLKQGKKSSAKYCLMDATRCYKSWGAELKVSQIETAHSNLLTPASRLAATGSMSTIGVVNSSMNVSSSLSSISNLGSFLNNPKENVFSDHVQFLFSVSTELQQGLSLGGSLRRIWKSICLQTGAERGCIALIKKSQLFLEIDGGIDGKIEVLQGRPLSGTHHCISIINYVTTVRSFIILDDSQNTENIFIGDPYIRKHKIKSILCLPLLLHNQVLGILYLENSLISGVFSSNQISVLSSVGSQIISLIVNHRLTESLTRQMEQQNENQKNSIPGGQEQGQSSSNKRRSTKNRTKMFRLVDRLLGYSWEICATLLTSNHLLIFESPKSTKPILRYSIESIKKIESVNTQSIPASGKPPTEFGLRILFNEGKFKLYLCVKDQRTVREWIMAISNAISLQPNIYTPITGDSRAYSTVKIWEDEVQLGHSVGSGASSTIFSATWHGLRVAVKRLNESDIAEEEENFFKEVQLLQAMRHPNILLFIGAYISQQGPCLVTEFMPKGDLYTYLHDLSNPLTDQYKLRLIKDITNGMIYLHSFHPPIIHRDLKSLNILIDENGTAKVADFGLARRSERNMTERQGTVAWMAPEVFEGQNYSLSADGKQTPFSLSLNFIFY